MRFNCDTDRQVCFNVVIGEEAFVQAGVLKLQRTLKSEAAAKQLNTVRQGAVVSGGKYK